MIEIIKNRIDVYLEFDSDILFFNPLIRIFGGAIRDSIAGERTIHDIDILCGSKSIGYIEDILTRNGYTLFNGFLTSVEIGKLYTDINVISEPKTWMKGSKVVQLIRPSPLNGDIDYQENFYNLLSNVDISSCGVSYAKGTLYENYDGAISHCSSKTFRVNKNATMYIERRVQHRTGKLIERGWKQLDDNVVDNREDKLNMIFSLSVEYTPEYGYIGRYPSKSNDDMFDDIWQLI